KTVSLARSWGSRPRHVRRMEGPSHDGRHSTSGPRSRSAPRRALPGAPGAESFRTLVVCVLLAALTLVAYGRVWGLGFVSTDDQPYVTENPHVLGGLTPSGIAWAFTATKESYWHPLTWLSLMLDATIGGADPRIYHGTNLALHVANTLLLFLLLGRMTG